jgi:hypothetical protein
MFPYQDEMQENYSYMVQIYCAASGACNTCYGEGGDQWTGRTSVRVLPLQNATENVVILLEDKV